MPDPKRPEFTPEQLNEVRRQRDERGAHRRARIDLQVGRRRSLGSPHGRQWVVITTNGIVRKDGACVMGRGVALQAAQRFPDLPFVLGAAIEVDGNHVHAFRDFRVFSFPVKQHWIEPADPDLIQQSARQLWYAFWKMHLDKVYLVRPGCGNGQLKWEDVKPLIAPILDDRFIVVERRA